MKMPRGTLTMLDLFGHPVGVNLHGQPMFRTKLGSFVSVLTYALILFNLVNLIIGYQSKSAQKESYQRIKEMNTDRNISVTDHRMEFILGYLTPPDLDYIDYKDLFKAERHD